MEHLKVTLIQTDLVWENPQANLDHFSEKITSIEGETDLILLQEMFTTGFTMEPKGLAESPQDKTLKWMQNLAQDKNAALSGSIIVKEDDKFYNRLYFVFPDGRFKTYDKRHLFTFSGEHHRYSSGTERLMITYKNWRICPLICYDLRFPVWARNTEHYDVLFYIANWPKPRIQQWDSLLKARSIENICYTAGLNRIGSDPNKNTYNGHSAVYEPLGNKITADHWEKEFTQTFTLSKSDLEQTRKQFSFLNDQDKFHIL